MNMTRCPSCGEDLTSADLADLAFACPKCGHKGARRTATEKVGNHASTQRTLDVSRDTGDNAAIIQTLDLGPGGVSAAARQSPKHGAEFYDFLASPERPDELGRLGTYRVLKVLGAGGMGVVYEAEDPALQRRVAVKAMLPVLAVSTSARMRFVREARAAAAVEHERIVPIFQVGEDRGIPFLVMPLLKGETLEDRLGRISRLPLSETVRIGREIAEALAAAHGRGLIHRDIKPANVWIDAARANVKLLDFGLARSAEVSDAPLTNQGSIFGTPAFMAPEQARGDTVDGRCDLFSLGCVLYRMSTGTLPFQGTSAVTILLAIVSKQPMAPVDMAPEIPHELSQLIMRLLAKDPAERPASAEAVIEALNAIPLRPEPSPDAPTLPLPATPTLQKITTPTVAPHNKATAIALPQSPSLALRAHGASSEPEAPARGVEATPARGGKRTWKILIGIIALAALLGAGALMSPLFFNRPVVPAGPIEIGITYGSEKEGWFKEAVADFAATPQGKDIKINLIPMGSVEGGQAVARKEDERIHVWSPASSVYRGTLVDEWKSKHAGQNPILKEENLCLTPMVFVFWKERHDAFLAKYKTVTMTALADAMHAKGGWGDIAGKPEWGRFRFGQTNPDKSNSGLVALLLMACEMNQGRAVTVADLNNVDFQTRLATIKRGLAGTSNSTGNLMKEMVTKGPSAYDAVLIYENLAIDYLKAAQGRWGDLHVAYPKRNIWNENPYYILDVPWSSKEQRKAAETFLTFLMSDPMQKKALAHGFRPSSITVPVRDDPDSPFVRHKQQGLMIEVASTCEVSDAATIDELLNVWGRAK